MTAEQAREYQSKSIEISDSTPEIKNFYSAVKRHIDNNSYHRMTYSTDLLTPSGVKYLETQGYGLEFVSDHRDGDFYYVRW